MSLKAVKNKKKPARAKKVTLYKFDRINAKLLKDIAAADALGLTYGVYMAEKRRLEHEQKNKIPCNPVE